MTQPDPILAAIAREHLNITTLATRRSDSLDFHNVAVWQVDAALKAAFDAGVRATDKNADQKLLGPDCRLRLDRCPTLSSPLGDTGASEAGYPLSDREGSMTAPAHSPAPWSYEYSPYRSRRGEHGSESELPAFEIFDADGNKVFDTNEDSPGEIQEANARMGATAPRLLAALVTCANLLADYDESDGPEGEAYREALAAVTEATGRPA
jgi:hypothetical protein